MSMKKWRPEVTVQFIEEYEKFPCLWDPSNRNYKRREMRLFALQQLINALGKSGIKLNIDGAKTKIRNLRNTYINELRKIAESKLSGAERTYKTSLYWFKEADRFLRNVVKLPDTVAQNCDVESDEEILPDTDNEVIIEFLQPAKEEGEVQSVHSDDNEKTDCSQPPTLVCEKKTPSSQQRTTKRKLSAEPERSPSKAIERLSEKPPRRSPERPSRRSPERLPERPKRVALSPSWRETSLITPGPDENEFEIFGRSIGLQMKKLPLEYALELQAEIQNAVVQKRLKVIRKATERQAVGSSSENQSSCSKAAVLNAPEDANIRVSSDAAEDQQE